MKLIKKRTYAFIIAIVVAFSALFSSGIIFYNVVFASTNNDYAYKYFYSQIDRNDMAKRFYNAFESLLNKGEFKKGKIQYDLIANNVVNQNEVAAYINGVDNNKLTKAFAIGRDAFYMDHPDLFYIDIFSTSISAGQQGNKNVAYLDSSRVLSMYKGSINSEDAVNSAIENYNNEISTIVAEAEKKSSVEEKIRYVNTYISNNNTYGYGTKIEGDKHIDTEKVGYIHTSYGALVNRESVCEGYAKSFKAVMDRLGIPCVCVQGYADGKGDESSYEPHMWNYVEVDGMWYLVDVTYNATSGNDTWMLVGEQAVFNTHIEDRVISSSGYELNYPALKPYDYGTDLDENGMTVIGYYEGLDDKKFLEFNISYNGKSAERLAKDKEYIVFRTGNTNDSNEIVWSNWHSIVACNEAAKIASDDVLFPSTDYETTIRSILTAYNEYFQFSVTRKEPNALGQFYPTTGGIVSYTEIEAEGDANWIEPTAPYKNNQYGKHQPSPGAVSFYPANTGSLPYDKTYDIKVSFSDDLEFKDNYDETNIKLNLESSHGNDSIKEKTKIENFKWDGARTITFTFTPSKMYIHSSASYYFTIEGLVGKKSGKDVDPFFYSFKGKSVVCSKVYNDGRLYMNVFGQPSLLDNSDVSITDFKDSNGKYYAESQRSQLILVASKPSDSKINEMEDVLKDKMNIKDNEIVSSSSYEINLNICGVVQKVPNGSYMQVAFGFPEGYDKNDAGTTFKIYHYKHDDKGNITGVEEIPVIVTEYGLIAKVSSFSPFTIVQVKNTSSAVVNSNSKNIYSYVNGNIGGTITTSGKSGITEVTNDTITYDINADDGYTIGCVRLNGNVLNSSNYSNGKLTINKNDIKSNNMLEVVFVSKASAEHYASNGITLSYGAVSTNNTLDNNSNGGVIVICCILIVFVVVGCGVAAWWFLIKNKPNTVTNANRTLKNNKNTKNANPKNQMVSKKTINSNANKTSTMKSADKVETKKNQNNTNGVKAKTNNEKSKSKVTESSKSKFAKTPVKTTNTKAGTNTKSTVKKTPTKSTTKTNSTKKK